MATRILVSNDDGIHAPGVMAILSELRRHPSKYDVRVACPAEEQSAKSHAVTLTSIAAAPYAFQEHPEVVAVEVWGTPADSVKLAVRSDVFGDWRPHLIVSGINRGSNTGFSCVYSGTVGAGMEGNVYGIPAVALSLDLYGLVAVEDFEYCAEQALKIIDIVIAKSPHFNTLTVNVNFPSCPPSEVRGWRLAAQDQSNWITNYTRLEPTEDEKKSAPNMMRFRLGGSLNVDRETEDGDTGAMKEGWITVTPLRMHFQDHVTFSMAAEMKEWDIFIQ
eukprot:TRINITY_DN11709_c0_g1_i1.p1 TRINITY_DN11709_c0_g1~~TRINITY_DN11709_c0_g1_i1.p1  ORF type:complete len:276 (-),score=87.80 TRINITY_DN11709_c0_g1_i1:54-881(-)